MNEMVDCQPNISIEQELDVAIHGITLSLHASYSIRVRRFPSEAGGSITSPVWKSDLTN